MAEYVCLAVPHIEADTGLIHTDYIRNERIVRCRDCIHAVPYKDDPYSGEWLDCLHFSEWDYYADVPGHCPVKPDFFCANGEMEEDE